MARNNKFQFHYGTIKSICRHSTIVSLNRFNSTMVRLKVTLTYSDENLTQFQFHYGTIKSLSQSCTSTLLTEFQFHYGTIKSLTLTYSDENLTQFQFHYGTIKSITMTRFMACLQSFNSTMVRLKDHRPELHRSYYKVSIPLWYD